VVLISACSPAYYNTMEKFGVYKRDILVDRVEEARDSQEDTKEQFNSALEQFGSVVNYDGGSLEKIYNRLQSEYDDSVAAADDLGERIDAIEQVAEDLFEEWESELDDYSNDNMRRDSAQQRRNTRREYQSLIRAMRQAQSKIPPVLSVFQDQVLYLSITSTPGRFRPYKRNIKTFKPMWLLWWQKWNNLLMKPMPLLKTWPTNDSLITDCPGYADTSLG